jgi:hypothetical protein
MFSPEVDFAAKFHPKRVTARTLDCRMDRGADAMSSTDATDDRHVHADASRDRREGLGRRATRIRRPRRDRLQLAFRRSGGDRRRRPAGGPLARICLVVRRNPAHHRTICRRLADSRRVDAHTHVRAYHRMQRLPGGDIWMVAGRYEVRLVRIRDRWKIGGITLRVFYQEENLETPNVARARALTPSPRPQPPVRAVSGTVALGATATLVGSCDILEA